MSDLDDICAGLEAKAGHLRQVLEYTAEAVTALRKLQAALGGGEELAPVRAALAPPPAAAATTDRHGHQVHGAARPRTSVCRNEPCGKAFQVKAQGRVPHYCSDVCRTAKGKRQRRAAPAPNELDGLARATARRVDELLTRPEPIPESGGAMRNRIRQAKNVGGPSFLDRARERNDEAARRNGVSARRPA